MVPRVSIKISTLSTICLLRQRYHDSYFQQNLQHLVWCSYSRYK